MITTADGKRYYRVSEILQDHFDAYKYAPEIKKNEKAKVGTNVHNAILNMMYGNIVMVLDREKPYIASYLKWYHHMKPIVKHPEMRLYCDDLCITGQIDCLVTIRGEKLPILLDYKCVSAKMKSWKYQAHFYQYLLRKNNYSTGNRMIFLALNAKGKDPIARCYDFDPNTEAYCINMAKEYHLRKLDGLKQ